MVVRKFFLLMLVILASTYLDGYASRARHNYKLQNTASVSKKINSAKAREVENIVRYTQQPVDIYWGASFGAPFYDSYYARAPYYGGYNYPYTYGIFFGW